ncbi:MAG: class I tRNA ligase family protein [Candidatus Shikimatogenerans bostrichidophilus]|nr:MAG: class I tRNA ligase family protein [Candidatus Shikimatogenerans bostrichidophilus]
MKYNFKKIEKKWKKKHKLIDFLKKKKKKKKYYILNMFPYPSGYGLHIGHTIGYIFSDIILKYKISKNYNVFNPFGFDSFGLPAEQFSISTGKHPSIIINKSIKNYKKQIKNLGIFYNFNSEIITSKSIYYKWTQFIFIKLFNSWYNKNNNKAENIKTLINLNKKKFYKFKKKEKFIFLNKHRLVYLKNSYVNWCPYLSTVLANDEIENGKSIRGGYNIIKKKMLQWHLRITKYNNRLLNDINILKWPKKIKNSQIKWIGKKKIFLFKIKTNLGEIKIYNKKKSKNINIIIFNILNNNIKFFKKNIKNNKKKIFNLTLKKILNKKKNYFIKIKTNLYNKKKKKIIFYITNYYNNSFLNNIYIIKNNYNIIKKKNIILKLNLKKDFNINEILFKKKIKSKNYFNLKDIVFSRQRYWGEPIPIYYKNNIPYNINIKYLPLKLPYFKKYKKLKDNCKWAWNKNINKIVNNNLIDNKNIFPLDTDTMPSFAASNWYNIRFIDPKNKKNIVDKKKIKYWNNVDLYIGGSEHTNGHLLYSRFCHKFLYDINIINFNEPFKKFINQGIILYKSFFIFKLKNKNKFISLEKIKNYKKNELLKIYISKKFIINKKNLNIKLFKKKENIYKNYFFEKKKNFICKTKIEKMSKSKFNIVNPNYIIKKYGIDVFRLYIIFFGPFNEKKIWNIKKINGIKRFIKKIWNIYYEKKIYNLKILRIDKYLINNLIFKIEKNFKKKKFNLSISYFMIFIKKIKKYKIINKKIFLIFLKLFSFFSPYISEEIWFLMGKKKSIFFEKFPKINYKYINKYYKYIIMINNKKKLILKIKKKNNKKKKIINKVNKILFKKEDIKKIKNIIYKKNKILNYLI